MPLSLGGINDSLRDSLYIKILRGVQLGLAIVVLGVSASNASTWTDLECSVPGKLGYNIAAVSC